MVPLPEGAQVDQANAGFENGVLRIEVPLAQGSREKIPVAIGLTNITHER